ncbi:MAG TPA: FlgD immunoglobulin-like domain containing protein, partial [Candidatus Saccharimonadales bacterium]|nr:FlgD immunoglobulin-like domain containing protein [Candidatus Saccharimonadales bacterium]
AQHALITGTVDPAWPANGRAVCTATGTQNALTMVADGSNGCIVGWQDYRSSNSYTHIYAQRVERFGYLGNPEPTIAGVRDVPNDQGGKVKLSWNSSYLEGPPFNQVTSYQIFRSLPPNFAARELARGARLVRGGEPLPGDARRAILATISGGATYYWEYLGSQSAYQFPGYSYYASTAGDSTGVSNQRTYLLVRAITGGSAFWNSAPDSGYSVDNLPPSKPQPFLGNYSGSATALHWGPNREADLAYYRVYRGETEDFVPGPSNLVAQKPDTGYVDHVAGGHYYKLCAVDVHGNPSVCALLTPQQAGAVPAPGGVATLWLGRATPNPTNAGARIDYGLPRDAWVRLGVYDAAGRLVRQLVSGRVPAGDRSAAWDGRDEQGARVAGGLYFFRLQVGGRTLTARLVAVH